MRLRTRSLRSSATSASWSTAAGVKRAALAFNVVSALTFPLGGLIAYLLSGGIDVAWLLPVAAGNFLYIGAADLIPQLHAEECPGSGAPAGLKERLVQLAAFLVGLGILFAIALV